jgi:copper(I)-binding protein
LQVEGLISTAPRAICRTTAAREEDISLHDDDEAQAPAAFEHQDRMMKTTTRLGLAALFLATPAIAHDGIVHEGCAAGQSFVSGDITVTGAFARATLPNAPVGGGYLTIVNKGDADRLLGAASEVAATIEFHDMETIDGMMKMEHLPGGIEVPAGGTVSFAPGGLHVMFIGPNQPFKEGECVMVTLEFEKAGPLDVQLVVGPVGAAAAPEHAGH